MPASALYLPLSRFLSWPCARWVVLLAVLGQFVGCQARPAPEKNIFGNPAAVRTEPLRSTSQPLAEAEVKLTSYESSDQRPPPRVSDFDSLAPWPMSLDEAVRTALENSPVIRSASGRVLSMPESVRTTYDPATAKSDPDIGRDAALSAFDTQIETGLVWNGGGNPISPAFSSGTFGVFSQPETMAKLGLGKTLAPGTQITLGGVGGYDSTLASGVYAAYGAGLRQPLLRGAGAEYNRIAGPYGKPGTYGGVLIAQIESSKVELELERAVRDLVWEVTRTYWELNYAYQNANTKRGALDHARQSWQREQTRVAEQASPPDFEALARQQYHTSDAVYRNAISGTAGDPSGVYNIEVKLRSLLALPVNDGRLIRPVEPPLTANFICDWNESLILAHTRRIELRKQEAVLRRRRLELKAAKNMTLPQVDLVGQYRRLADDESVDAATFGQALQGWQLGIESRQALGLRRERSGVYNAELLIKREQALYDEQQRQIATELRLAFIELDRSFGVMQTLAAGRDAARISLESETARHAAGDAHIERVLQAQNRATLAETAFLRALVDYNLAVIQLHFARGTLLDTLGVGFTQNSVADETPYLQLQQSVFGAVREPNKNGSPELIPRPSEHLPQK
jgi:outer membrane protein TolC